MSLLTLSIGIPIFFIIGGAILHFNNLNCKYNEMLKLVGPGVTKDLLYKEMTIAQGSNFSALAMAAWMMMFVAIAYLYFLIPGASPYSYMMFAPEVASNSAGFFVFGIFVAAVSALLIWIPDKLPNRFRNLKLSELYSFYNLSKNEKIYIGVAIPLFGFSIVFSAYSGTIYPNHNSVSELLSFIFLILPMGFLILPIWRGRE